MRRRNKKVSPDSQLKKLYEQATKDKDLRKIVAKIEKRMASLLS